MADDELVHRIELDGPERVVPPVDAPRPAVVRNASPVVPGVTERAQQLGGAAASAASSQGVPADPAPTPEEERPLAFDPLGRIEHILDDLHGPREHLAHWDTDEDSQDPGD